jgi:NADH:ubiquinone oxidoreductase subunit F (NADH-binding)
MTLLAYAILGTLLVLSSRKLWTMPPCREGTGWLKKYYTESKTVTDEEDIDLLWSIKVKLKETQFVLRRCGFMASSSSYSSL